MISNNIFKLELKGINYRGDTLVDWYTSETLTDPVCTFVT